MSQKIWEINGMSLELDLEDADCMERYENAFEKMSEEEKQIPKDGKYSAIIRAYCRLYRNMYDRIFGEGTSEKLFKGIPENTDSYNKVYCEFLDFVTAQRTTTAKKRAEILSKYRPNRQQRRNKKT